MLGGSRSSKQQVLGLGHGRLSTYANSSGRRVKIINAGDRAQ